MTTPDPETAYTLHVSPTGSDKPRCRAIIDLGPGVRGFKICGLDPDHDGEHKPVGP